MPKRFRAALIGCGSKGKDHANTLARHERIEFVACGDVRPEAAEAAAREFGVPHAYGDPRALLRAEKPDLVVISTQVRQHHELTLAAAEAGAHVFCEKPMALTLVQADEMIEACRRAGVRLAINHQKRASAYNGHVRRMIEAGEIGDFYLISAVSKGGRKAGNELMEMGTHLFDYVRVFGGDVEWAHAHLTTERREAASGDIRLSQEVNPRDRDAGLVLGERAFCSYRFRSGVHAEVHFRMQPRTDDREYGMDLIGSAGRIALRRSVSTAAFLFRGTHQILEEGVNWQPLRMPEEDAVTGTGLTTLEVNRVLQSRIIDSLVQPENPPSPPISSGEEGRASLEMIHGAWESHRRRARVPFPLGDRGHPLEAWR
ncbi:MAG: Gfo/Idh/MocA family oxidoreductase [Planctomycetes bacterium]|nr:Gfo/Idh/MocA family oxidoreductase [Planctomycetota bacterium]